MDGSFACPECGNTVEVQGLTPGRQTRCGFCNRLVEVPFIPRAIDPSWRRARFRRSRWALAAWSALGLAFLAVTIAGVSRLLIHRSRNERLLAVDRLRQSATQQRDSAAYGSALVDLDSAIELLKSMRPDEYGPRLEELKRLRGETARQDAEKILRGLTGRQVSGHSSGEWLNLRARIAKDADLAGIKKEFESRFQSHLLASVDADYRAARASFDSGRFAESLDTCLRLDHELKHLLPDVREKWRGRVEELVEAIVQSAGVVVTASDREALAGPNHKTYTPKLAEEATKALRDRGYLPPPSGVAWSSAWSRSPFHLDLQVVERREGNYQASHNRLARIEVHLILEHRGSLLWEATSTVRSAVPLPKIPASFSNRLAIGPARIDEFEALLYENARSRIDGQTAIVLKEIPPCPARSGALQTSS